MAKWSDKQIRDRAAAAFAARGHMRRYFDEAYRYAMPWRQPGGRQGRLFDHLFDDSGPTGAHKFASRMQANLTPPYQRWFELQAGPLVDPAQAEAVNRDLELATALCHAVLDAGAFIKASHEMYSDLGVGTGALLAMEGDDREPIRFTAVPPWMLGIEEGYLGRIDNVFWERTYPADQLKRLWPDAQWSRETAAKIAAGKTDPVAVLQASYFDGDLNGTSGGWRFHVLERQSGQDATVHESESRTNPWIIPRWWTTPGGVWGVGPILLVLPSIMTANKAVQMILTAAAYSLAPALMVAHDGVVNPDTLRIAPHALIRVARTAGPMGPAIQPLDLTGRVDLTQLALQDMRTSISQNLMARQLPPESAAVRSPTEIVERMREFLFDTGAAFGRMNHEFVPPLISRVLDILDRRKTAGVDFSKMRIDQLILKVKVTSPLARSQNLEDVSNIVRYLDLLRAIGGDELRSVLAKLEDLHKLAPLMGVPGWVTRPEAERNEAQQRLGEAAADGQAPPVPKAGDQQTLGQPVGQSVLGGVG